MKRILKIFAWLIGLVFLTVATAVVVLPLIIDPNDYKEEIAALVKKQTGRELTISGDIELSVFPWLGLDLGAVKLGNAPGFGEDPFAAIERVKVGVKLMPLFSGALEVDTVILDGLFLNLQRNAQGVTNWADLTKAAPADEQARDDDEAVEPEGQELSLALAGVVVRDARAIWDDAQAGRRSELRDLNLELGALSWGQAFPLKMSFTLQNSAPAISGQVALGTTVSLDLPKQLYTLHDLQLEADLKGATLPGGRIKARLQADAEANLAAGQLTATVSQLSALGLNLNASVSGDLNTLVFKGKLGSKEFVPADLLAALGVTPPVTADPSVLSRASLSSQFEANSDAVALSGLKMKLDDSTVSGSFSYGFTGPRIRYDLSLDSFDADRYLPPPSDKPAAGEAAPAAASAEPQLPLEFMRAVDIKGSVKVGSLKLANLRSTNIHATLTGKGGQFRLNPLGASLYQGSYKGDLRLDVRRSTPVIRMDEHLSGVQAGPLLIDLMGKDRVTGAATVNAVLEARGLSPASIRATLTGNADFRFENGAIKGFNIGQKIREAYAALKGQPKPAATTEQTDFTALSGSVTIQDGLVRNNDLRARSPLFSIDGKGTVHLVTEKIDYRLSVTVRDRLEGTGDELKGTPIPITIGGTFKNPKFGIDLASILEEMAREAVEERVQEQLQEQLQQQLPIPIPQPQGDTGEEAPSVEDQLRQNLEQNLEQQLRDQLRF